MFFCSAGVGFGADYACSELLTAAVSLAAFTAVFFAAIGCFTVAFTDFSDDDHDVSFVDSILSASVLNWAATYALFNE